MPCDTVLSHNSFSSVFGYRKCKEVCVLRHVSAYFVQWTVFLSDSNCIWALCWVGLTLYETISTPWSRALLIVHNSHSSSQEITCLLCDSNVHCGVLLRTLSQMNPINAFTHYLRSISILSSHLHLGLPSRPVCVYVDACFISGRTGNQTHAAFQLSFRRCILQSSLVYRILSFVSVCRISLALWHSFIQTNRFCVLNLPWYPYLLIFNCLNTSGNCMYHVL
jgi:hypothetical protein